MADARIDFITEYTNIVANQPLRKFSMFIPDDARSLIITPKMIRDAAIENNPKIDIKKLDAALTNHRWEQIAPVRFNVPVDEEEPDILDHRLSTIDYGGITCVRANFGESLCSASSITTLYGAEIVKNLKLTGNVTGGSPHLKEFYGDIIIESSGSAYCSLFVDPCSIQKAVGEFRATGIKYLNLCTGHNVNTGIGAWFNVIDIRNVDTSKCQSMQLLNYINTPCTLILGNFSNENMSYDSSLFMRSAPKRGRVVVMTTAEPPKFKNCKFSNGVAKDEHGDSYDWVKIGKIERILVPEEYKDAYINNTYIENGTKGKTGWSYYGPSGVAYGGKDIIRTYSPNYQYLPKKEGGENGRTVWIYRKSNRR